MTTARHHKMYVTENSGYESPKIEMDVIVTNIGRTGQEASQRTVWNVRNHTYERPS